MRYRRAGMVSWLGMIVVAVAIGVGGAAASALRKRVRGAGGIAAAVAALLVSTAIGFALVAILRAIDEPDTIQVVSVEQPLGIVVRHPESVTTDTGEDGTLHIRMRGTPMPVLTVKTIGAPSGTPGTQLYREGMQQAHATQVADFAPAPLPFAPNAQGALWRTPQVQMFGWVVPRPGPVNTVFQCVAALDSDPRTACQRIFTMITLDTRFVARMYEEPRE